MFACKAGAYLSEVPFRIPSLGKLLALMQTLGQAVKACLMFAGKAEAYLTFQVPHSRVSSWPFPQTLDYAGKGLTETNILAYYINYGKNYNIGLHCI